MTTAYVDVERSTYAKGYVSCRHSNPRPQLIYPCDGVMQFVLDDGLWTVPPMRACWVPAQLAHVVRTRTGFEMLSLYIENAPEAEFPNAFAIVGMPPLHRELIMYLEGKRVPIGGRSIDGRVASLLMNLIDFEGDFAWFAPMLHDPKLQRIQQRLQSDISDQTTHADWAKELCISERSLNRLFHADVGISFGRYRQQQRLAAAIELLEIGRAVNRVAFALGFQNPGAFTRMFQRATGMSPKQYQLRRVDSAK